MERIFGTIPAVLEGLGANEVATEALVFSAWRQTAGEMLSKRTVPTEFFENRLVVAVEDIIWKRNLEELAPQMLFKLNREIGEGTTKFIEFRIDPVALKAVRKAPHIGKFVPEVRDVPPSLKDAARNIADESLRESFLAAAAAYLSHSGNVIEVEAE
ncbi:MAG: DUF721 domain-containing protein [Pyrinomonadaceae bacterium]